MRSLKRYMRVFVVSASIGSVFFVQGCDANVQNTLLDGIGSAATQLGTSLIQALITTLQNETTAQSTTTQT